MPQVDLRPFFPSASRRAPALPVTETASELTSHSAEAGPRPLRIRLTGPQVTNIAFVVAACLGAVVSALYLYKGGEVFQEVAAWPRELFYGRPVPITQTYLAKEGSLGGNRPNEPAIQKQDSGDPFSPASKLLNLDPATNTPLRPNGRSAGAPLSTSSSLNSLNVPSPGGDALSRALMQGTSDVGNATAPVANSAVAVPQTIAAKAGQIASAQTTKSSSVRTTNAARQAGVRNTRRLSSGHGAIKTNARSQKLSSNRKAALGSGSKAQTQALRSTTSQPGVNTSSASMQSPGAQALGGIGHSAGASGAGIGLGAGHSLGHIGGR